MTKLINSTRAEVLAGDALLRTVREQVKRFDIPRSEAAVLLRANGISEPEIREVCYDV